MSNWIKLYERGKDAFRSARPRDAVRHFRKAKEVVEFSSNPILAGTLFMRLSGAEMACHKLDAAFVAAQKAVEIAEQHVAESEGQKLLASSSTVLACATAARGETEKAMQMLRDLLARIPDFNIPELAAEPLEGLADFHLIKRDYLEAERLYKQAYELRRQSDPTSYQMLPLLDRLEQVCNLNYHREDAERFAELRTECLKERIIASGDPRGLELMRENDRLQAKKNRLEAEKTRILGEAVIDAAVEMAIGSLSQGRQTTPWVLS